MKYRLLALAALAAVAGCASNSGFADPNAAKRKYPEQPLQIINRKADVSEAAPAADPSLDPLMEALRKQQDALARLSAEPAQEPAPPLPSVESTAPVAVLEPPDAPAPPAPAVQSTDAAGELSVERLIERLAVKAGRTPGEEEAYRRLLSAPAGQVPASAADEYGLLGEAQAALLDGRLEDAQGKANAALALIRRRTDPRIDRVCFAWTASSYGDAELAQPAEFAPGQVVLAVTDLSNFACLPVGTDSPPSLHYVKMSQRLAIYDAAGKLYWEYAHGPFEYQASLYFSTMFIPVRLTVPPDMRPGDYVLKVEITDVLAGRQSESSADFKVK